MQTIICKYIFNKVLLHFSFCSQCDTALLLPRRKAASKYWFFSCASPTIIPSCPPTALSAPREPTLLTRFAGSTSLGRMRLPATARASQCASPLRRFLLRGVTWGRVLILWRQSARHMIEEGNTNNTWLSHTCVSVAPTILRESAFCTAVLYNKV